jgi:hypothetical protein
MQTRFHCPAGFAVSFLLRVKGYRCCFEPNRWVEKGFLAPNVAVLKGKKQFATHKIPKYRRIWQRANNNLPVIKKNSGPDAQPMTADGASLRGKYCFVMKNILLLILFVSAFTACRENNPEPLENDWNPIRFDNLQAGQKSHYIRLKGQGRLDGTNHDFQYLKDTLVLEVLATGSGEGFTLKEYLTPGSEIWTKPKDAQQINGGTDAITFKVQVGNAALTLVKAAPGAPLPRLFLSGIETYPFALPQQPEIAFTGWQPDVQTVYGSSSGRVKNHKQMEVLYPELNLVYDYRPMTYDGPGHFHLYSAEKGIVRSGWINPWSGLAGEAWDLLEE